MQLTLQSSLWDQDEAKLLLKTHLCLASSPAPSLPYRFLPSASQQDICARITFTGTAPKISMSDVTLKGYSGSIALIMTCVASVQFSSVQWLSRGHICDPMACSTPGFPVHNQLPELTQTHVHRVGDAIQTSHPLSSPSPPAFIFPSIRVFSNESVLCIRWPKYWNFSFSVSPSNRY